MAQFFDFMSSNWMESSEDYLNQIQEIYEIKQNQIKIKPNQANYGISEKFECVQLEMIFEVNPFCAL